MVIWSCPSKSNPTVKLQLASRPEKELKVKDECSTVNYNWDGMDGWYLGWVRYRESYGANKLLLLPEEKLGGTNYLCLGLLHLQ